ncbi:YegP family protein [Flavobacterium sp. JP2137]|uniref:YegP family protein n=1 Tax=Flavobacterium sp. JP2137 TaxID=3414510 RepID=UPI003D2FDDF8
MAKFVIQKESEEQFSWILKTNSDEVLLTSVTFTTKENCLAGIENSKKYLAAGNFKDLVSVRDEPYFNQLGRNYQVLGTSPMYETEDDKNVGIENVKRKVPTAIIEDLV